MSKFSFILFVFFIILFVSIFYVTQKNSLFKNTASRNQVPTLPPESSILQLVSPSLSVAQQIKPSSISPTISSPTFGVSEPMQASYSAVISTSKGDIVLTLFGKDAPRTVKNFIDKAKSGYYNGLSFHRVEDWVIQGGDPNGDGTGGGTMQTELNTHPFVTGSLGVARGGDINVSNDSQFFITKTDASWLNQQYTNFGIVTKGMGVVSKIAIGDKILGITIE